MGLPIAQVVEVLKACKVGVSRSPNGQWVFALGTTIKSYPYGDQVSGHDIGHLAAVFKVPTHFFYHPEMIPEAPQPRPPLQVVRRDKPPAVNE